MKKLFLGLMFILMVVSCAYADQHDYVIGNAPGAIVRADINNALKAIVTNNAGATAPAALYPGMWWLDTSTNLLKHRNNANDAWIITGLEVADADGTLSANSDLQVPTQKAVKTYSDTKIALSGNETITGIKTYSVSPIVPTPTTDMQASTKKYVDDKAIQVGLGSWVSKSNNTVYEAATDGFVCAGGVALTSCTGYTDSSNPPTTQRMMDWSTTSVSASIMMPVKKGDYWKVVGGDQWVYWIPFGPAGS